MSPSTTAGTGSLFRTTSPTRPCTGSPSKSISTIWWWPPMGVASGSWTTSHRSESFAKEIQESDVHLFPPRAAYRFRNKESHVSQPEDFGAGKNPTYGASIHYYLKELPEEDGNPTRNPRCHRPSRPNLQGKTGRRIPADEWEPKPKGLPKKVGNQPHSFGISDYDPNESRRSSAPNPSSTLTCRYPTRVGVL